MTVWAHKVIWNRIICQWGFKVRAKEKQSKWYIYSDSKGTRQESSAHKKRKVVETYAFEKHLCGLISSLIQNSNGSFPKYMEKKSSSELCFMTSQNELEHYVLQKHSMICHGTLCHFEITTWIALYFLDSFPTVLYGLILKIWWKTQHLQLKETISSEVLVFWECL